MNINAYPKNGSEMSKDEQSLLLFLETCAVDQTGLVDHRRINATDREIIEAWKASDFIRYGRVYSKDVLKFTNTYMSNWVYLSSTAFAIAHQIRYDRALTKWAKRHWRKTDEMRADSEPLNA